MLTSCVCVLGRGAGVGGGVAMVTTDLRRTSDLELLDQIVWLVLADWVC